MALSALHVDAAEMAGVIVIGGYLAAGLALTEPERRRRRRRRRRATVGFRLRRRRNFWRYLLGWGELPEPARKPSTHAFGRAVDLPVGFLTAVPFRSAPLLDVDRITQEG